MYDYIIDDHFEGSLQFDGMHGWSVFSIPRGEKTVLLRADPPKVKTDILIRIRLVGQLPRDSPTVKQMQNILLRKVRRDAISVAVRGERWAEAGPESDDGLCS